MNLDMNAFRDTFFEEAADLLADLEGQLLRLEENPKDPGLLNTIFRCAHSIKGGSATFGLKDLADFTHHLETLLDQVRNGQVMVDSMLCQLLLEALDQMKSLVDVARGDAATAPDSAPLIARIEEATLFRPDEDWDEDALRAEIALIIAAQERGEPMPVLAAEVPTPEAGMPRWRLHLYPGENVMRSGMDPILLLEQLRDSVENLVIRCDDSRLPALTDMDPESTYFGWEAEFSTDHSREDLLDIFAFIAGESRIDLEAIQDKPVVEAVSASSQASGAASASATPATGGAAASSSESAPPASRGGANPPKLEPLTLRVSADKMDKLINLVGELVISQSMLNEAVDNFHMNKMPQLLEAVAAMERSARELQERVMAVRLLQIKQAFGRFPRLVRDLATVCGKKIDLRMSGEETELDKNLIEAIADPLTHLVRNSVDHGLETPEERRLAGKPETGVICLNARHEGGSIVVEVQDDGRGLNRDRILQKAIERGLINGSDPVPSDEMIYGFIFNPGFSTAAEITDVSGRGVGMDIVRQTINGLGGSINLTTRLGKGTTFRIRLPLTMAILEGLSMSVGEEVFIVSLTSIIESIRPKSSDIHLISGQGEVVMVRGEALPILRLYKAFGAIPRVTDPSEGLLVIVENENRKVALLVDDLIGQNQVVIKSMETNYRKVDGIAGATIMGDGRVALIVDVPALVRDLTDTASYRVAA